MMIRLRGVTKVYWAGEVPVPALQNIDLDIDHGEFVSIVGASGSGESTLMNVIGLLDRPSRGTYELEGHDVGELNDRQLAKVRCRRIGFVFQAFNLLARPRAIDQVELPLIYLGVGGRNRRQRAARALAELGLADRIWHKPAQLSGGQQQRVAIARALVTNPSLILADEPTGQLDTKSTKDIVETFVRLNRELGITVVFVTHEAEVAEHTRRTITLRDGRIISDVPTTRSSVVRFPGTVTAIEPAGPAPA